MTMRILVTGAAGLIGGELAARLAAHGHAVTALVHRSRRIVGNDRRDVPARPFEGRPAEPGEVVTLVGDVRVAGFGAPKMPAVDLIVHAAAITAFDAAPGDYRAVNVEGTANAVVLAAATRVPLIQVSTAYVCGTRDGPVGEASIGRDFVNGYEASKAAAEGLVADAMARGLRAAIARPSIVVGDSTTGAIRQFDNIYAIFRLIAEGRVRTLPGAAGASLDLVPIDHVCNGIAQMVDQFAAVAGRTLHLVAASPTPLAALGAAIGAVPGLGAPVFVDPADFKLQNLPAAERRWHMAAAALYTSYLLRGPLFDTANAARLVPACPPTGRDWLDRLIAFCVAEGFVTARRDRSAPALSA